VEEEIEKVGNEETREVYMTIAEQLRAEGIEIGKQEGKIEGKQEGKLEGQILDKQQVLARLLEKKFGPLDDTVKAKIRSCQDRERLDEAIDLFADGETLEQIIKRLD
jgi:flagellar biosynthesis/type III secretory pathway protein FliH